MKKNKTLSSVILWSVISAAFIGPGTVTTAAMAGSLYQLDLLWAVTFATLACIMLQEVSGRLTIVSGLSLGQALQKKYGDKRGAWLNILFGGPVILGCAAYEAGNILGAVAGLNLISSVDVKVLTTGISLFSFIVLWADKRNTIGWLMTSLVLLMGIAFFVLAMNRPFSLLQYVSSSFTPTLPPGAELLTLGLVGTTIVPYNLFLGSSISKGQTVPLMRIGIVISVVIGGLITAAILVAGSAVQSFSNFDELGKTLTTNLGPLGGVALGIGLFAAGFSSAITSPYAASTIASTVFNWNLSRQRLVWISVLLTGFVFGISGVKPVPVILAVQALNGLVLPLLTAYLILLVNDSLIVVEYRNSGFYNSMLLGIFGSVLFMGLNNIDKSVSTALSLTGTHFMLIFAVTIALTLYLAVRVLFFSHQRPA
ncbi:MAG TPA: divalent metal cation transporter [Cyclobacteriaceae bacterium]|nr:divalent metal cation transporter [Cyclobacteriaceae bacterium]